MSLGERCASCWEKPFHPCSSIGRLVTVYVPMICGGPPRIVHLLGHFAAAALTFFIPASASWSLWNTTAPCVTTGGEVCVGGLGPTMKRPVALPPCSSTAAVLSAGASSARCTYGHVGTLSSGV